MISPPTAGPLWGSEIQPEPTSWSETSGEHCKSSNTSWVNEFPDGEEGFSEPRIYEKRQVQVEAMRADGSPESNRAIIDWTRGSATPATMDTHPKRGECLSIATLEGAHWVDRGDFVIRGVAGEHYPCKPEIFEQTYIPAPVQEAPSPQDHVPLPAGPPLFGGDHALWIAFRATRSAVRGLIGEDAPQPDPEKLADQAVCMADFLRSAPDASDEAIGYGTNEEIKKGIPPGMDILLVEQEVAASDTITALQMVVNADTRRTELLALAATIEKGLEGESVMIDGVQYAQEKYAKPSETPFAR